MEFIPLGTQPHRGIGLELDPEAEAIRQQIRASWSEQETESRAIGPSVKDMAHTFNVRYPQMLAKRKEFDRARKRVQPKGAK